MQYEEFVTMMAEKIRSKLAETGIMAEVEPHMVEKPQGESYYGVRVTPEGSMMGILANLTDMHGRWEEGENEEALLTELSIILQRGWESKPRFAGEELLNYENVKRKIMLQVIPVEGNQSILELIPHHCWEDLAMVYRMILQEEKDGEPEMSILITNELLRRFEINEDQLQEDVLRYAPRTYPASFRSITRVLEEITGEEVGAEMFPADDTDGLYVASCSIAGRGAGCMFYPGFLKRASKEIGGDLYILPSSIHEILLLKDSGEITGETLLSMVREINAQQVALEDRLTDSVYYYRENGNKLTRLKL